MSSQDRPDAGDVDQQFRWLAHAIEDQRDEARRHFWASIFSSMTILVGTVAASWLLAGAAIDSARLIADSTIRANSNDVRSQRDAFVATQRRESYAQLGRTARFHLRKLNLAYSKLDAGRDTTPPINVIVGTAHGSVRDVAVDTNLVGDAAASHMASCIEAGFDRAADAMERMQDARIEGTGDPMKTTAEAKRHLTGLRDSIHEFVEYGAKHLLDSVDAKVSDAPSTCQQE